MDLFESSIEETLKQSAPLAARLRPDVLDDVAGQLHLIGEGKPLRALFESGLPASLILWGPPGTGKTTIARLMAEAANARWVQLSAVSATVADVRSEIASARQRLGESGTRTLLFLDEIHRFNRAQQDSLLQAVEDGLLVLVGATTENPYFEVNAPLLSRSLLFRLESLSRVDLEALINRALSDSRGLKGFEIEPEAVGHLVEMSGGDARQLLNTLEWAALIAGRGGKKLIKLEHAEAAGQSRLVRYDRSGDQHYDVVSAFIKSMRGSDSDAALHWLARMLDAGEDPKFIARRMVIFASEDVGNADPQALPLVIAAAHALDYVGLPEARINLAQAVTYLAQAPKSNASYVAVDEALADVRRGEGGPVPPHLRDSSYAGAAKLGHGTGYRYPHDYDDGYIEQNYLPTEMNPKTYYRPKEIGYEAEIAERIKVRRRSGSESPRGRSKESGGAPGRENED